MDVTMEKNTDIKQKVSDGEEYNEQRMLEIQRFRLKAFLLALVFGLLVFLGYLLNVHNGFGLQPVTTNVDGFIEYHNAIQEDAKLERLWERDDNKDDKNNDSKDDSNKDDSDKDDKKDKKVTAKSILDKPGIRVVLAIFGLIIFNMIAICIHHLYHISTRSDKSYRNVEHVISPF